MYSDRGNDLPDEQMPSPRTWCTSDGRVANLSFCPQIYQVQQFVQICEGARGTMEQLGGNCGPRNTRLPGSAGYLAWTVWIVTRHCNKRLIGRVGTVLVNYMTEVQTLQIKSNLPSAPLRPEMILKMSPLFLQVCRTSLSSEMIAEIRMLCDRDGVGR